MAVSLNHYPSWSNRLTLNSICIQKLCTSSNFNTSKHYGNFIGKCVRHSKITYPSNERKPDERRFRRWPGWACWASWPLATPSGTFERRDSLCALGYRSAEVRLVVSGWLDWEERRGVVVAMPCEGFWALRAANPASLMPEGGTLPPEETKFG